MCLIFENCGCIVWLKRLQMIYLNCNINGVTEERLSAEEIQKYLAKYFYVDNKTKEAMSSIKYDPKSGLDNLWTMWMGREMPETIKMCLSTIKRIYPNITVITEENIDKYIVVPEHIADKYKQGIIEPAHFSDWVRVYLLDRYGGTWIDASCLLMDKVPQFILKQDFFILQNTNKTDVSNFFMHSAKNNYLIKLMRIFLEEYWANEDKAIDYLFFHRFFSYMCKESEVCRSIFQKQIPYVNSVVKYFTYFIGRNADDDLWEYLSKTSFIYKYHHRTKAGRKNPYSWYYYLLNLYKAGKL